MAILRIRSRHWGMGKSTYFAFAAFCGGMCLGQTMLQHAAVTGPAAVGATAGAAIGSKLGPLLGNLTTKVEAASKQGETTKKPETPVPAVSTPAAPAHAAKGYEFAGPVASFGGGAAPSVRPAPRTALAAPAIAEPSPEITASVPLPPPPTAKTRDELLGSLASIQPGTARDVVIEKLGSPAYKLSYDEDGVFVERFRFRAGGQDVLSIELRNGSVAAAKSL